MRAIVREIDYGSRSDYVDIVPFFDVHLGNAACDESLLKRTVRKVGDDPNCFWIGGGDLGDFINRKDKRHRETAIASWLHGIDDIATTTKNRIVDTFKPIKNKCLGLLRGNHEATILKHHEVDIYAALLDGLRIDHKTPLMLGWQGFIVLKLRRLSNGQRGSTWTVKIYAHHGYGGGRLEGGHALTLGRIFKDFDCDIALMGHRHVRQVLSRVQVGVTRNGKVENRYQVGAMCGSFLKSYSEDEVYPEEKGLPAQPLGSIRVRLWPDKKKIEVTV